MKTSLTRQEIDEIFAGIKNRVTISCDEAHAHSALDGCISPNPGEPQELVTICKLVEHCWRANKTFDEVAKILGT